jgi:release factor glutamine methyltransferase
VATVDEVLRPAIGRLRDAGSESPRLDAELLLGHALGVERTTLIAHPDLPLGPEAAAAFEATLARREAGEPVAYIRGFKEFRGIAFSVDDRALIPRPETEVLVELAEEEVLRRLTSAPRTAASRPLRLVDVGTGSGTIAVALAVALRKRGAAGEVRILATDVSGDALQVARENAVGHGVAEGMEFEEADLLPAGADRFDVVLANLPYVASGAIDGLPIAASFEPRTALDGGADGLDLVRRLLALLPEALADGGVALLEIGSDQPEAIRDAVQTTLPGWDVRVEPDLTDHPRVAVVRRGRSDVRT